jgi:hypothetical protein
MKKDSWMLSFPVGAAGFEPATSRTRTVRSTGLSHAPQRLRVYPLILDRSTRHDLEFKWTEICASMFLAHMEANDLIVSKIELLRRDSAVTLSLHLFVCHAASHPHPRDRMTGNLLKHLV